MNDLNADIYDEGNVMEGIRLKHHSEEVEEVK